MSLMLTGGRKEGDAGYFRIGDVILSISPEAITTEKISGIKEITPLRSKYCMYQKTGHDRWQVTATWKVLMDPTSTEPYQQWKDLRRVLAMFRAAPFVQVENGHLRQILFPDNSTVSRTARMAFGLRQLKVDTLADIPDGLQATLTMDLFNYAPYSVDFGYISDVGISDDAYYSSRFTDYLDTWIKENLDEAPNPFVGKPDLASKFGYPDMTPWEEQNPGDMSFTYREYQQILYSQPRTAPAPDVSSGSLQTPVPSSGDYPDALITAIASEIRKVEGWTIGKEINGVRSGGSRAWRNHNPGNLRKPGTKTAGGYSLFNTDQEGWEALKGDIRAKFRTYPNFTFLQFFQRYAPASDNNDPAAYARRVINTVNKQLGTSFTTDSKLSDIQSRAAAAASSTPQAQASPLNTASTSTATVVSTTDATPSIPVEVQNAVTTWLNDGWSVDNWTEAAIFLYRDWGVYLDPQDDASRVAPTQTSVVFVNNLVTIPLEGYQYPTCQHIGPAGTMIVVSLTSNGLLPGDSEPEHPGLSELSDMISTLEDQYHRLKGTWRATASIHRMQAVIVENQVLNMLGIRGALCRGLSTETVEEAPGLVQGTLLLTQYENIFESLGPFKINAASAAYKEQISKLLADKNLDAAVPGGSSNAAIKPLFTYRDNRTSNDPLPIVKLMRDSKMEFNPPFLAMSAQPTLDQQKAIKTVVTNLQSSGVTLGGLTPTTSFQSKYPAIGARLANGNFGYADWLVLSNDPVMTGNSQLQAYSQTVGTPAKNSVLIGQLYDYLFQYQSSNDPQMINAFRELEEIPAVSKALKAAAPATGPGSSAENQDHGAYRDLGLKDVTKGGIDFNPAYYFMDYGQKLQDQLMQQVNTAAAVSVEAYNTFNNPKVSAGAVTASGDSTVQSKAGTADLAATQKAIFSKTIIPYHSMSRAFPTFKLFFCEEANDGPFYMFDNVYSYGSVLSIEVENYRDRPDLALIQITNFSNLLSHKLFDSTSMGQTEKELSNLPNTPTSSAGGTVSGVPGKTTVSKNIAGIVSRGLNLSSILKPGVEAPLQYFPLQTGSKIQIRMGYANNPDNLFPMFSGVVTEIEGEEILTVRCQGFLAELLNTMPEDLQYDSPTNLSTLSDVVSGLATIPRQILSSDNFSAILHPFDLLSTAFGAGSAYGGLSVMRDSGLTDSVMSSILHTAGAKHFGHWQVDTRQGASIYLKGFGWSQMVAQAASDAGATNLAKILNGYDRSGENICINRFIGIDGTSTQSRLRRGFEYEQPLGVFSAVYHVPKDPENTPWKTIRDVARRYPDYILAVKPYRFPFGVDATLVFAHPNDFYLSRPPLASSSELDKIDSTMTPDFKQWWSSAGGKELVQTFLQETDASPFSNLTSPSHQVIYDLKLSGFKYSDDAARKVILDWIDRYGAPAFDKVTESYATIARENERDSRLALFASDGVGAAKRLQSEVRGLRKTVLSWLQNIQNKQSGASNQPRPGDMVQPVRRWHLITKESIVSNSIRLNDQIFNAVRVCRNVMQANGNIPPHHLRILDANRLIIEPIKNAQMPGLIKPYSQSFLREEVGKMYNGDLVLRGTPEIQPHDVLLINDPSTGIVGPIEVDSVIHSLDLEMGYVTIVRPRALVIVNEFVTAGIMAGLQNLNLREEAAGLFGKYAAGADAALQAGGAAFGVSQGANGALALAAIPLFILADMKQTTNPVFISPLSRFGKPWVGGLEGWGISDLHNLVETKWKRFWNFEIEPTLESFRRLHQIWAQL